MILGVTGSRNKPAFRNAEKFYKFLCENIVSELHHGDCLGWDESCYWICNHFGITTVAHPPTNDGNRAFTKSTTILTPKPYLDRNKDIVNAVEYIIAAPGGPEKQRSGTWSTVRYAKKVGVKGVVWM